MSGLRRLSDTAFGGSAAGATAGAVPVYNSSTGHWTAGAPKFNAALGTYNVAATNYRRTRAACARTLNASGSVKVAIYGHSVVNNTGASSAAKGWPARLNALMQAKFGDAGDGVVSLVNGQQYGPNMMGSYQNLSSVTKTATADRFRLWVAKDPGGGTITPSIDAVAQSVVTCTGTAAWATSDYTFAQGSHTITFATTGLPTQGGLEIRRNAGVGAQVWSFGVNGQMVSGVADNSHPPTGSLGSLAVVGSPDLVIVECSGNDFKNSTSISAFTTSWNSIASTITAAGVELLIVGDYQFDPAQQTGGGGPNSSYITALQGVCDTYNVGMLDLSYKWGTYAIANAAPVTYMSDTFHPNDAGHQDIASSVYQAIQSLGVGA